MGLPVYTYKLMYIAGIVTLENTTFREHRKDSPEAQLIFEAKKGDRKAFNELVLIYQDAVYNLAYRFLGDADSAEDIAQVTFIKAYRHLPGFKNGSFRSWLFHITTNTCYDELRRWKRQPVISIETEDLNEENFRQLYDWPIPQDSPEQVYARQELHDTIQGALKLIEPDQRAVIVLVDLQDLDYHEAAQVLRIPIGTVKSRLARGREHLRKLLIHREL